MKPLDALPVQVAFDSVELLAALTNESSQWDEEADSCNGLHLVDRLRNRTFELSAGNVQFNARRARILDLNIYGFNATRKGLQVHSKYDRRVLLPKHTVAYNVFQLKQ